MSALPCGCCEPSAPLTPLTVVNRAGLSAIAYRAGTYASFRATMGEAIAGDARLAGLTTREDDDYAITLIDLWAAVGDVLTFYQERYANEAFLRTATERRSIGRLARLIDYSLRPGVAALAWLVFTLEDGAQLRVPPRLRVQSVPGQDELPQTFETIEAITADARLNRVRVLPPPYGVNPLAAGATEAIVQPGEDVAGIGAGDTLLVYATGPSGAVEGLVVAARRAAADRVTLAWRGPVQADWPPASPLNRYGRTFGLFGHAAPSSVALASAKADGDVAWALENTHYAHPGGATLELDARVDGIAAGASLLVDDAAGATTAVTVVAAATRPATAVAGQSDTVTILQVAPALAPIDDRRTVTVYELTGPPVPLWGHAYPRRLTGAQLLVSGAALAPEDVPLGRRVLVGDARTEPVAGVIERVVRCGATVAVEPTRTDATSARELGLDAAGAVALRCALGARPARSLSSPQPQLRVRIGELPECTVAFAAGLEGVAALRAALEHGIRAASPAAAFSAAHVHVVSGRLLVVPGVPDLTAGFGPAPSDPVTVRELGLDHDLVRAAHGLATAPLAAPVGLSAHEPQIAVTIGPIGPRVIGVRSAGTLAELAKDLIGALRGADPAPGFARAVVLVSGTHLLVLPGPVGHDVAEYLRIDLGLDAPLDLDPGTAYLLGNVAAASHGETVRDETAGSGDAAAAFQRFELQKSPLTFVPSAAEGGLESSLQVSVGGVAYDPVPGLYHQPGDARVYATRIGDDGRTALQFGDGMSGARVPTGRANVSATYRVGAGVAGRVRAGTLTTALDRLPGFAGVVNPLPAHGSADPERSDEARANAPTTVRTFGRAVSLADFADLLRDSRLVAKAQAIWIWDGLDRAVHVTVAGQRAGVFTDDDLARLAAAVAAAREPDYRLRLANFAPLPIVVKATVGIDRHRLRGEVLAAVRAALLAALDFDAVALGRPIHLSDVYRVIQDTPGVVSADVDELQPKREADRDRPNVDRRADGTPAPLQPHVRVFTARPDPARPGRVLPAELVTLDDPSRDVALGAHGGIDG